MAFIKAPRRYRHGEWEMRRPRGRDPRGPLRGGPERSAEDQQRKPRSGLCGGPERSAKETQTPHAKDANHEANGERRPKKEMKKEKRPSITTVDDKGKVRKWGPLSRNNAMRVGCYWEDMGRGVRVYIEKDWKRKEVEVEVMVEGGREAYWLKEVTQTRPQLPTKDHEEGDDKAPEPESHMQEVDPDETRTRELNVAD